MFACCFVLALFALLARCSLAFAFAVVCCCCLFVDCCLLLFARCLMNLGCFVVLCLGAGARHIFCLPVIGYCLFVGIIACWWLVAWLFIFVLRW